MYMQKKDTQPFCFWGYGFWIHRDNREVQVGARVFGYSHKIMI